MTVGEWLEARTSPPPALVARMRAVLGLRCDLDAREVPIVCQAAAEELLAALLGRNESGRESALDLLAADALTTYAFEYASSSGGNVDDAALQAMQRVAAIGAGVAP